MTVFVLTNIGLWPILFLTKEKIAMKKFVNYLRTSTNAQNLGIEAQRAKAQAYAKSQGGQIIAEFEEHESGKKDSRPQLAKAITHCENTGATLLIAKLDRLSRRVAFLFELKERLDAKGLEAVCVDMPELMKSTLMLGVMASLAQQERELISERTKAALQAKKAQGLKLGRAKGADMSKAVSVATEKRKKEAQEWAEAHLPAIKRMAKSMNTNQIAITLNEQGLPTRRGGKWTATAVKRILARAEA